MVDICPAGTAPHRSREIQSLSVEISIEERTEVFILHESHISLWEIGDIRLKGFEITVWSAVDVRTTAQEISLEIEN
jgi:hypothetical protein